MKKCLFLCCMLMLCSMVRVNAQDASVPVLDIEKIVQNYELKEQEGSGLVILAKLLDKPQGKATYEVVLFDIASRQVLKMTEFTGKARGFGLRNYWAGSVYKLLEHVSLNK